MPKGTRNKPTDPKVIERLKAEAEAAGHHPSESNQIERTTYRLMGAVVTSSEAFSDLRTPRGLQRAFNTLKVHNAAIATAQTNHGQVAQLTILALIAASGKPAAYGPPHPVHANVQGIGFATLRDRFRRDGQDYYIRQAHQIDQKDTGYRKIHLTDQVKTGWRIMNELPSIA